MLTLETSESPWKWKEISERIRNFDFFKVIFIEYLKEFLRTPMKTFLEEFLEKFLEDPIQQFLKKSMM